MATRAEYEAYARQQAKLNGLDPDLFVRQIDQESGFNPEATSSAGARGIAQIVPKSHPGVDVSDPFASLAYAAKLMRSHLDQFGSYPLALAAYNAGAGAVQKYGGIPPYEETRRYVQAILRGASSRPEEGDTDVGAETGRPENPSAQPEWTGTGSPVGGSGAPGKRAGATGGMLGMLMTRIQQLEKNRTDLAEALAEAEAEVTAAGSRKDVLATMDATAKVNRLRAELAKLDTGISQAYSQTATISRAYDQLLNAHQGSLTSSVASGRLTLDQAKNAWENVLQNAATLRTVAPIVGNRQMAEAIRRSILNYGKYGVTAPDIGEMPLIPLSLASGGGGMVPKADEGRYRQAVMQAVTASGAPQEPAVLDPKTGITAADTVDDMLAKLFGSDRDTDTGGAKAKPADVPVRTAPASSAPGPVRPVSGGRWPEELDLPTSPPTSTARPGRNSSSTPTPMPAKAATPAASAGPGEYDLPPQPEGMSDEDYVELIRKWMGQ